MNKINTEEINTLWNELADDWEIHIGKEGDGNRILNSDPVLWEFAGDVRDLFVLDAGCGTGYLSGKLHEKGAKVTGVDLSEKMIEIAKKNNPHIEFHVDSVSVMSNIQSDHYDMVIANYVIMDTPDLQETMDTFSRVLKQKGIAILIFSHPCFPQETATVSESKDKVSYLWHYPYFKSSRQVAPPWGRFKKDFIWFHRPLSDYWKAFKKSGFNVIDFEEPRTTPDKHHLFKDPDNIKMSLYRPYSVAFKLEKA